MAEQRDPEDDDKDEADGRDGEETTGGKDDGKKTDDGADGDDADEDKDGEDDEPPLYTRPVFWIVLVGVALVLGIGGLLWWLHARHYESTDDAFVDTHIVRLAAETTGRLTHVIDADNRHVRRGELLAVIEPGSSAADLAEAQAGIAEAEAAIAQAQARVLSARASVRQAAASAKVPLAEAARARRDYARYLDLRRIDPLAAAPTQLDQARAQAENADAQVTAARRQVDTARADVLGALKQVEASRAQRQAAQARVAQANVTLSYLRIRAPLDGQLVNRAVTIGSYVSPGTQLMAIVPDYVWVTANFKETQLTYMRKGQPARIRIDAYPGHDFLGHVDSIQRGAGQAFQLLPPQNATGNYVKVVQRVPVRILFNHDDWRRYAIGPGMSVVPRVTVR